MLIGSLNHLATWLLLFLFFLVGGILILIHFRANIVPKLIVVVVVHFQNYYKLLKIYKL